jgi:ATP-dependent DNA helicase PIF1
MLIKNMDETLANGSMGRVVRFEYPDEKATSGDKSQEGKATAKVGVLPNPVVEFLLPNGVRREVSIVAEVWKIEANGQVQYSRTQVSLPNHSPITD